MEDFSCFIQSPLQLNNFYHGNCNCLHKDPDTGLVISLDNAVCFGQRAAQYGMPYLAIVEQPAKCHRFRYETEQGGHGPISGSNSSKDNKTFPTVELRNYRGPVKFRVQVYTCHPSQIDDNKMAIETNCKKKAGNKESGRLRLHVHRLANNNKKPADYVDIDIAADPHSTSIAMPFSNLAVFGCKIDNVAKRLIEQSYTFKNQKYTSKTVVSDAEKEKAKREAKTINLSPISLCFSVFSLDGSTSQQLCPAVLSTPIINKKTGKLRITRVSVVKGSYKGGTEIFAFCDNLDKTDISIKFYCKNHNNDGVYLADALFTEQDVHRDSGIVFRTPYCFLPGSDQKNTEVYYELFRPSDKATSNSITFIYTPDDELKMPMTKMAAQQQIDALEHMQLMDLGSSPIINLTQSKQNGFNENVMNNITTLNFQADDFLRNFINIEYSNSPCYFPENNHGSDSNSNQSVLYGQSITSQHHEQPILYSRSGSPPVRIPTENNKGEPESDPQSESDPKASENKRQRVSTSSVEEIMRLIRKNEESGLQDQHIHFRKRFCQQLMLEQKSSREPVENDLDEADTPTDLSLSKSRSNSPMGETTQLMQELKVKDNNQLY